MSKSLIRLQRISLLLAVINVAAVFVAPTAHAGSGFFGENRGAVLVYIDKTNQQMTVSLDGVERYRWPVSTGRAEYSTPSGTYTATSMNEIWYSKEWDNAPMPHSIFFMRDGHAIHGSYDVKNLGKPVSHGCVRISPENAAILYNLVQENGLRIRRSFLPGLTRAASITSRGVRNACMLLGHCPTPLITIDPLAITNHLGAFFLGEDQVGEFAGGEILALKVPAQFRRALSALAFRCPPIRDDLATNRAPCSARDSAFELRHYRVFRRLFRRRGRVYKAPFRIFRSIRAPKAVDRRFASI